jgi:hypothetical protein
MKQKNIASIFYNNILFIEYYHLVDDSFYAAAFNCEAGIGFQLKSLPKNHRCSQYRAIGLIPLDINDC